MKFIGAICIFIFIIFISVQANDMTLMQSCKKKANCKEDIVKKMTAKEDLETEECYCALGCMGKEKEIFTDNGLDEIKFKAAMKKMLLSKEKMNTIIENYKASNPANDCEAAKTLITSIKSVTKTT